MEKNILEQYADLIREREELKNRIRNTELKILALSDEVVADSVTHGKKGGKPLKRTVIIGTPTVELDKKRRALQRYKAEMAAAENRIGEMIAEVQQYINGIDDSRIRRIIQLRYVDQLSWMQVAHRMGRHHTAESCRKTAERFMKNEQY